jgi:hypothetical protein
MLHASKTIWLAIALWCVAAATAMGPIACDASPSAEECSSGTDEDQDGLIGCADDDCWVPGGICAEVCDTIFDEDGDGRDGCEDPDCWLAGGVCEEECAEEGDQDGDGLVGCDDPDCWPGGACDEQCGTGNDEDGDGFVDCGDDDCWIQSAGCLEVCFDGNDEDGDGLVDCDDDDCDGEVVCIPTFASELQPVFLEHCSGDLGMCHSDTTALGGLSFDSYDTLILPSLYCPNLTKAECSLFRILEPSMPQNCFGCVPQADIDLIQEWVDAGFPP